MPRGKSLKGFNCLVKRGSSIPLRPVHEMQERRSGLRAGYVLSDDMSCGLGTGLSGDMRRHGHVPVGPERVVFWQRFCAKHI